MPADPTTAGLPLSGVVVLDLTLARAGPTCVRHLADWGADVIRIEPPMPMGEDVVGRRNGPDFQNLHRNKRMVRLDLKSEAGYEAFIKLVKTADVLIENMRAPVKGRLKIDYETLKAINPKLIYGSISGFGQTGPYSNRGGVDQIAQGMGGLMSVTGVPGQGPLRVGIPITDLCAGSFLAIGVSIALFDRTRTGKGKWVQTSLLESQIFMLDFQASRYLMKGEIAKTAGNDHPTLTPSGVYPTSDGHMNLSASSTRLWDRLCDALGHSEWKEVEKWRTAIGRTQDRPAITENISSVMRQQPMSHWDKVFEDAGIPAGPINTIDRVFADPQVKHIGMAAPVKSHLYGDTHVVASPINFHDVPKKIRYCTQEPGTHTDEVLKTIGYSDADIAAMRKAGVV